MNKLYKAAAAILIGASLLVPKTAFAADEDTSYTESALTSRPVVTSYSITNSTGKDITSLNKNIEFNLSMTIRDLGIKTSEINGEDDIDIVKTLGDFSGNLKGITILSTGDQLLTFTVNFEKCKWNGAGSDFGFMLGYLSVGGEYSTNTLTIAECGNSSSNQPSGGDAYIAEPTFKINATGNDKVITAGSEGYFTVDIKNIGEADADRILVEIAPSDDTILVEGSESQEIRYLLSGQTTSVKVRYKALDKVNSTKQSFAVSVKYCYYNGTADVSGSASGVVSMESEPSVTERVYPVVVSEFSLSEKELSPNKEYNGTVTLKNIGTADMKGVFVNLSAGDSFILTGSTGSAYIPSIEKDKSVDIPVKLKTLGEIAALKQELSMSVKYTYVMGSEEIDGAHDNVFTMFAPISKSGKPNPVVTAAKMDEPISGGHKYKYYIYVENMGDVDMEDVKLNIKGSDGLVLVDSTDSVYIEKISAGKKKSVKIYFQTAAELAGPTQQLTVDMSYSYTSAGKKEQAQETAAVSLDTKVSGAPVLRLYGENRTTAITANNEYDYTITVRNFGDISVKDIYLDFTASDSLYFLDGTEYAHIDSIKAGGSADITVRFKTMDSISSVKQAINAAVKFSYGASTSPAQGETSAALTIIAAGASDSSSNTASPNLIIGGYDIGADQIAAGEVFDLALDFVNTSSSTPVENIIMTVNASGDLNIYGGGNSFYYPSISAAGQVHETVSLRALATAATGTSGITIEFKYDYLDGGQRNTVTSSQTIFVPIYQPDKITFDVNVPTYSVMAGNDVYITTSYMNKGRCDISNVKAELVGDVSALSTTKVIGNVAPGGNGTFDFIVNPYMGGECSFTIKITYEDATFTEVTKEIPVSFMVEEMMWEDPGMDFPMEDLPVEEEKTFPWWIVIVGSVIAVVIAIIVICDVVKKKKKSKKLTADDIDWGDDDDDILTKNDTNKV